MISGPRGWAVCHDTAREPRMFLGHLHSDDVRLLNHEFGLHRRNFLGHQLQFKDSIAGRALKQIMLHDPVRAALFRKADASLDNWAEQVASEKPACPTRLAIQRRELTRLGKRPREGVSSLRPSPYPLTVGYFSDSIKPFMDRS